MAAQNLGFARSETKGVGLPEDLKLVWRFTSGITANKSGYPAMTKVHPNGFLREFRQDSDGSATVLTVWKKSLLLSCSGFTVFDSRGNLVFRVDNYVAGNREELVLMDFEGKTLFTMRRKKLSLSEQWQVFEGEALSPSPPIFSMRKHSSLLQSKVLAHVYRGCDTKRWAYQVEGSYSRRICEIHNEAHRVVAEIKRKENSGGVSYRGDVFKLLVEPELDSAFAMALVLLLDQMFSSKWSP
ncbi:hypothetical protein AMTRI_Chr01g108670 [Amborella trichopoda]|uniref:Tubby C-terminal domain-containing protein n=1 Tax=Amborella trichopoda TaxID=13333 RepID=W1PB78_AMBTC|nr:protein LURP-one-related 8 [Amborella trichopoda]ERN05178.1 hypothetical protein AMTR_s00053p00223120 [Amborella trichopoda]|eukprot:XP_006843503.1 protein LURP-one-related 8 [Amborella trichopoda]